MFTIPPGRRVWGVQLPVQARSSYFVSEWEHSAGPAEMARVARAGDELGAAYVAVCDHVAIPAALAASMGTHWVDPLTTLGWIAGQTTRTMLLTHAYVLPYRHPALAAKQFATLDHLSGGRAICGVGAGHVEGEFTRLGVDFHRRGRTLDAGLAALAAALEHEFVEGCGARPRPVQQPRPPIWVAGSSAAAIARAARAGDGWLPQGPATAAMVAALEDHRAAAGRADEPFAVGHITPFLYVGDPAWDVPADTVTGPSDAVAAAITGGAPAGVNQLQVRFRARDCAELLDQLAAFATDVAPFVTTI